MENGPRPLRSEEAERRRIVSALTQAGFCLPGSVNDERTRCGKPGCRCKADPPVLHGPYHHWTRKIDGKTVGRYLSDEQLERYGEWFDQARRLRELFNQLETLSLRIAERAEGWDPQSPPMGHRPRPSGTEHKQGKR
ncbi:MAG: DUF6788 family protein [Bryobacteraceae bacterium]